METNGNHGISHDLNISSIDYTAAEGKYEYFSCVRFWISYFILVMMAHCRKADTLSTPIRRVVATLNTYSLIYYILFLQTDLIELVKDKDDHKGEWTDGGSETQLKTARKRDRIESIQNKWVLSRLTFF